MGGVAWEGLYCQFRGSEGYGPADIWLDGLKPVTAIRHENKQK